jgi:hypothetical protein
MGVLGTLWEDCSVQLTIIFIVNLILSFASRPVNPMMCDNMSGICFSLASASMPW